MTREMYPRLALKIVCFAVIAASVVTFVYSGIIRGLNDTSTQSPVDFYFFYTAGQLWNEGLDPYDHDLFMSRHNQIVQIRGNAGYYYPPQASMLFALLANLPVKTAYLFWLGVNLCLLLLSLLMLAFILSRYRPVRLLEITLLISFIGTGFGRMNVREGQTGLLLCVLTLAAFILVRYKRNTLAGLALGALAFKPTFVPLYAGYYLLRRSYRLIIVGGLTAGLLTILPVLLTQRPLVGTMMGWLDSLKRQNAAVTIDSPSPFTPNSALMVHLEPLVYRVLNTQSTWTTAAAWAIVLLLIAATAYLLWQSKPSNKGDKGDKGEFLDFALVSALSLISIYHRPYDIFLLFPGILYLYLHAVNADDEATQRNWAVFIVSILLLLTLPIDLSTRLSALYPALLDDYLWRVVAPFQAWAGVAVFGALFWLKARQLSLIEQSASERFDPVPYQPRALSDF